MKLLLFSLIFSLLFILKTPAIALDPETTPAPATPTPPKISITPSDQPCSTLNKNTVYPPNGECYDTPSKIETNIEKYPLTCIPAPEVSYKESYFGTTPYQSINVTVSTDLSQATLGFLGPDLQTQSSLSPDMIAQKYLFTALFDKPSSLEETKTRESFRTYWRMLNSLDQANIKALYLQKTRVPENKLNYYYLNQSNEQKETDTFRLYQSLPSCLKKVPVCDEYFKTYNSLPKDVKSQYDALMPFDFEALRSYVYLEGNITKENIPYLSALISGLKGNSGLLNFYTPQTLLSPYTPLPTQSEDLSPSILANIASSIACDAPEQSSSIASPKTYPDNSTLSQTVNIPLSVTLTQTEPSSCDCSPFINNQYTCERYGCTWIQGGSTYELTGQATGKPLVVFNNPYAGLLDQYLISGNYKQSPFYKMLLPSSAPSPDKLQVSAPQTNTTSQNKNASISNPSQPVYRESNLGQDAMLYLQNCWLVPNNQQKASYCKTSKEFCGEIKESDLKTDSACKINTNSLGLPPSLVLAIESAGAAYKVPPALIVGILYGEGAFNPGSKYKDEAFVKEHLQSCVELPNCNQDAPIINNIVQFFQEYWPNLSDAIKIIDPERKPNGCNLLDGIFALAKDLQKNRYGSPSFAGKTCFGIPLNSGAVGGDAKSCSNWTSSDVETAIRVWEFGTAYNTTYSCATAENSCLTGGGQKANCPAGADTCETLSSRYPSAPSHNACVWDIYQSNK